MDVNFYSGNNPGVRNVKVQENENYIHARQLFVTETTKYLGIALFNAT